MSRRRTDASGCAAPLIGAALFAFLGFALPFLVVGSCASTNESFPVTCAERTISTPAPYLAALVGLGVGAFAGLAVSSFRDHE